jgi:hypothetical protein
METENNRYSGRKIALLSATFLLVAFLIYYAIMIMLGPGLKLSILRAEYSPAVKEGSNSQVFTDSTYLSVLKEKAFLQARVTMAQTDSIYMTINLKDSTSAIEISGVTVHSVKISSFEVSGILHKCDQSVLYTMLSVPFTVENSLATIKKEPVMIKVAPKDTSEYKPDIMPDTSFVEPVNYILEMKDGTRIYVYQEETKSAAERKAQFRFDFKQRTSDALRCLKSVMVFKVPEYHPFIKIWIPREDAKILYRALPVNGQVGVYTSV